MDDTITLDDSDRRRSDALFAAISGCSVSLVGGSETPDGGLESSEDGWAVTEHAQDAEPAGVDAAVLGGSRGTERRAQ
jgi:hypothetical protein